MVAVADTKKHPIRLVLSDVDGTLVTHEKVLTPRAIKAVDDLREAGILFAITSARPPQALTRFIEALKLTTPLGAFNGGLIIDGDMSILEEKTIDEDVAAPILDLLKAHGQDIWVYQGTNWYVQNVDGPHVAHEAEGCSCEPTKVLDFQGLEAGIFKIVGVSDDAATTTAVNASINERYAGKVAASQSQSYFLDVTSVEATKGNVVRFLAKKYDIDVAEIAAIGDMHNDVAMFDVAGLSIAMGNAHGEVQHAADVVTTTNDDEGFSNAIEKYVLA
jgi:Cof subfamily protein (haloacid dehalogenase superfamily)